MQSKGIQTAAKVITKIIEIGHWVGVILLAAVAVCSLAAPQWLKYLMSVGTLTVEKSVKVYSYESNVVTAVGAIDYPALCLLAVTGAILCGLMALVFRNMNQIIKSSEDGSPFQPDNIRRLREIGIFSIAGPIVSLVMSIVTFLVVGPEFAEVSVDLGGFTMGILILCLTQYFIYGAKLEADTEGLL